MCERGAIQGKKKDTVRFLSLSFFFVQFFHINYLQDTVLHVVSYLLSEAVSFPWKVCVPLNFTHAKLIKFLSGSKLHLRS